MVMVNDEKRVRAEKVVANPNKFAVDSAERKLLSLAGDDKDPVLFIYKGLGGLVLSEKEEAGRKVKATAKKAALKK